MSEQDGKPDGTPKTPLSIGKLPPPALPRLPLPTVPMLSAIADVGHSDIYDDLPEISEFLEISEIVELTPIDEDFEAQKTEIGTPVYEDDDVMSSTQLHDIAEEMPTTQMHMVEDHTHSSERNSIPEHPSMFSKFDVPREDQHIGHLATQALEPVARQNFSLPFANTAALPTPIANSLSPILDHTADESDLEGLKTEVIQSPFESDTVIPKILVLGGPNAGQEFFVTGLRATLGRGDANSIVIHDLSISRQHIEIIKNTDDSFSVRDLQSINGTTLNGTRIREADLFHGDRMEMGKTTLQFLMQGNVPSPSRHRRVVPAAYTTSPPHSPADQTSGSMVASAPDITRLFTIATIMAAFLTLLVVAGIFWILASKGSDNTSTIQSAELAGQRYFSAVEASKVRDWESAEALFTEASTLDPNLKVDQQLEKIQKEKQSQRAFENAEKSLQTGDIESATKLLAQIPEESVYYSAAQSLLRSPKTYKIDELFATAQRLATAHDFEQSRARIEDILARVPNHIGARQLLEQVDRLEEEQQAAQRREEARKKTVAVRPKSTKEFDPFESVSKSGSSSSNRMVNFTEGFRLYRARDFNGAARFFDDIAASQEGAVADRAQRTSKDIQTFARAFQAAEEARESEKWAEADTEYVIARRADAAASGSQGYFFKEISQGLSEVKASLGLQAFARKDFARAHALQKEAHKLHSGGAAARKLQQDLLIEARSLYIRAAGERKSNPASAASLCRTIISMLPANDPTYEKAQAMLKEL